MAKAIVDCTARGERIAKVQVLRRPPSLQIKFSGDVAEIEKARVEATLRGDRLQRGSYEMRDLSTVAEWNNQQLNIAHCEWNDGMGSFAGRGELECGRQQREFPGAQQSGFESFS